MKIRLATPLLITLLGLPAHADIVWTGATSTDVFDESNWDLSGSTVTVIDPNVTIDDNVVVLNAAAPLVIPDLGGQIRFQVGDGFMITLDSSTLNAAGNDGVGGAAGTTVGPTIRAINGARMGTFFITNSTHLDLDATSNATFGGGATPINGSTVNMTFGSVLAFTDETVADFTTEHLSKLTVDGAPAVIGVNIDVVSDGATGSIITVIPQLVGASFCVAAVNSTGVAAQLSAVGDTSVAVNTLELVADGLPPGEPAIFFYGSAQTYTAFGNGGVRCVAAGSTGVFRVPAGAVDAQGRASASVDMNGAWHPNGFMTPGSRWYFQCWYADSGVGVGFNSSDGVMIDFTP